MSKIKLSNINIEPSLSKKRQWLEKSVSHSNLMVILADLDSIDRSMITSNFIKNMILDGYKRINNKDLQLINEHRLKNNQSIITMEQLQNLINDVKNVLIIREN